MPISMSNLNIYQFESRHLLKPYRRSCTPAAIKTFSVYAS
jgi:hypothetical protein